MKNYNVQSNGTITTFTSFSFTSLNKSKFKWKKKKNHIRYLISYCISYDKYLESTKFFETTNLSSNIFLFLLGFEWWLKWKQINKITQTLCPY